MKIYVIIIVLVLAIYNFFDKKIELLNKSIELKKIELLVKDNNLKTIKIIDSNYNLIEVQPLTKDDIEFIAKIDVKNQNKLNKIIDDLSKNRKMRKGFFPKIKEWLKRF